MIYFKKKIIKQQIIFFVVLLLIIIVIIERQKSQSFFFLLFITISLYFIASSLCSNNTVRVINCLLMIKTKRNSCYFPSYCLSFSLSVRSTPVYFCFPRSPIVVLLIQLANANLVWNLLLVAARHSHNIAS
jgi:hypothetical protein